MTTMCPNCNLVASIEEFDLLYACPGHIFCPDCNLEFDPRDGQAHHFPSCPDCNLRARALHLPC